MQVIQERVSDGKAIGIVRVADEAQARVVYSIDLLGEPNERIASIQVLGGEKILETLAQDILKCVFQHYNIVTPIRFFSETKEPSKEQAPVVVPKFVHTVNHRQVATTLTVKKPEGFIKTILRRLINS